MNKGRHPTFSLSNSVPIKPPRRSSLSSILPLLFPRSLASCEAPMVTCGSKQGKLSAHKSPDSVCGCPLSLAHLGMATDSHQPTNPFRCQTPYLKSRITCVNPPCFSPPRPLGEQEPKPRRPGPSVFLSVPAVRQSVRPSLLVPIRPLVNMLLMRFRWMVLRSL